MTENLKNKIRLDELFEKKYDIFVVGHRGANAEAPENTLKSFRKAIEIGADMIEFDIHITKDGEIVVTHDASLMRVAKVNINVENVNYSDLVSIDMGEGEKLPRLDDLFEEFKDKIIYQIEIKQAGLVDELIKKIKKYNLEKKVLISSFKHQELIKVKELMPEIPVAALEPTGSGWVKSIFSKANVVKSAISNQFEATHPFYKMVNKKIINEAHAKGIAVNPWTIDKEEQWKKLIDMGVDGIITNDPRKLIEFLKKRK